MDPNGKNDEVKTSFVHRFKDALQHIHLNECPEVPNPPSCKRRAAVAVILRVRPAYPHQAVYDQTKLSSSGSNSQTSLDNFFSQDWVQHGEPEVLLIKRAARTGDRWTSHIALPGGKRDPGDSSDAATSVRETREEIGLELETDHCLFVGNLPQRIITTAWGKVPLMVLCPFVYLSLRHDLPPLALQPSEVHSAHWVPLNALISPSFRRDVRCDISERFTKQKAPYTRLAIRSVAGQFVFAAVKLKPTESLYSNPTTDLVQQIDRPSPLRATISHVSKILSLGIAPSDPDEQPMLLWGLTLGIMADILEKLDFGATSRLWSWPTFSPWDIRFVIWLLNRNYHARKIRELSETPSHSDGVKVSGLDDTTYSTSVSSRSRGSEAGVIGMMLLTGYTERLRRAVIIALCLRFVLGATLTITLVRRYLRRR